ncbi:ditrans,polycis-polyprenyl diphosphate synthase [(2E,6E)-farnesydiphosphate specific] [Malassezia psittaci]|uniref:ditrans,polycis-polyprenyl diphosphate synthase [(2E,6E)-farnesyldiphosphate specific] n=1 Tax=Malassezia psittaci TaxID=1821823 RepID=A0AAF0F8B8_9BASI|nr:ditrans,polycis-polyprenyl diphosphate synthase [(2E,6E)-farnesydiphosphate specific] [Malassezia psittaci]
MLLKVSRSHVPKHIAVVFPLKMWKKPSRSEVWKAYYDNKMQIQVQDTLQDVARLSKWCATLSIPELTVYDPHGILYSVFTDLSCHLKSDTLLQMEHSQSSIEVTVCMRPNNDPSARRAFPIYAPISDEALAEYRRHSDSFLPRLRLNVLSAKQDKLTLVEAASQLDNERVTPFALHEALLAQDVMTCDPDMVVVCGDRTDPLELYRFPCWAIRLADIHSLPYYSLIGKWTEQQFLDTLRHYSRAEQRFGA